MRRITVLLYLIVSFSFLGGTRSYQESEASSAGRLLFGFQAGSVERGSTVLESFATWFSGLVDLNPRFGGRPHNPRQDWGSSGHHLAFPSTGSQQKTAEVQSRVQPDDSRGLRKAWERSKPSTARVADLAKGWPDTEAVTGPVSGTAMLPSPADLPKVALMFLTRGDMPYEATWRRFLEAAPTSDQEGAGWRKLYTLYVHPGQNHTYPADSLFFGKAIAQRENVQWGQWSVMQAERNLLAAALSDRLNERFVLLSESCIPLYPAVVAWAQLLMEPRSRIHACCNTSDPKDEDRRMTYRMQNMEQDGLRRDHWRKSGQWIALNQKHARLVVEDNVISRLFRDECWVDAEHLAKGEPLWRFCVSDEHYVPTLLAFLGLENETDCMGSATNAWWDGPYFHPKTWEASDVSLNLIAKLRRTNNGFDPTGDVVCPSDRAVRSAEKLLPVQKKAWQYGRHLADEDALTGAQALEACRAPSCGASSLRAQLDRRRPSDEWSWLPWAVLQPGSPEWWEELDVRGIAAGPLVDKALASSETRVSSRQLMKKDSMPETTSQPHWEAVKPLLSKFEAMSDPGCPLFARKFSPAGADRMAQLAKEYTSLRQT